MKGSIIALVLFLVGGGLVYLLLSDTYSDLERLESETHAALENASSSLVDATRKINEVRAIRPNLTGVDEERNALARQVEEQARNLEALKVARPTERDSRTEFIRARQAARDAAGTIAGAAANLAQRVGIIDEFTRSGQEVQRSLAEALQRVFELKKQREADGKPIDPVIEQKIESMRRKRETLQEMSRTLYALASGAKRTEREGTAEPASLRIQAKTIENESKQLAADLLATYKELGGIP